MLKTQQKMKWPTLMTDINGWCCQTHLEYCAQCWPSPSQKGGLQTWKKCTKGQNEQQDGALSMGGKTNMFGTC